MVTDGQTPLKIALADAFSKTVIDALITFGDKSVEELYEHIAYAKGAWYHAVPGINRETAVRLVDWLKENAPDIGEITSEFYPKEESLPATRIRETTPSPLKNLPETLSGKFGSNRGTGASLLEADNDLAAIRSWLKARAANPNTRAQYEKEAERFLLWATMERRKALSSVGTEDAALYTRWLEALGRTDESKWAQSWHLPQTMWIGPKNAPRLSSTWRPFNGPLSSASRKTAATAVRLLFTFLTKTGYLRSNPFDQVSSKIRLLPGEGAPKDFADRSLSSRQWEEITEHLEAMPDGAAKARLRVILSLGKGLGMRASEIISAKTGWITTRRIGDTDLCVIEIIGKGDKVRRLPVPEQTEDAVNRYLATRNLPAHSLCPSETPILTSLGKRKTAGLSRSGLYKTLCEFFESVALAVEVKRPSDAEKLRAGSTHWLRHTFAVTALKTMDINLVQTAMGHASIGTTSRYLAPEEAALAEAMKKVKPL